MDRQRNSHNLYKLVGDLLEGEILQRCGTQLIPVETTSEVYSSEAEIELWVPPRVTELFPEVVNNCLDQLPQLALLSGESILFQRLYQWILWCVLQRLRLLQNNLPSIDRKSEWKLNVTIFDELRKLAGAPPHPESKNSNLHQILGNYLEGRITSRLEGSLPPAKNAVVGYPSEEEIIALFDKAVELCLDDQHLAHLVVHARRTDLYIRVYRRVELSILHEMCSRRQLPSVSPQYDKNIRKALLKLTRSNNPQSET